VLLLRHGQLVDDEPVIACGLVEVQGAHLRSGDRAARPAVLDRDAVRKHPVEGAIAGLQRCALGAGQTAEGILQRFGRQRRVEPCQRLPQPIVENDIGVASALGRGAVWG